MAKASKASAAGKSKATAKGAAPAAGGVAVKEQAKAPAAAKPAPKAPAPAPKTTGKRHRVVVLLGDGTGPELASVTRRVLDATGVGFDWVEAEAGVDVHAKEGTPLPQRTLDAIREAGLAIKAPVTTPVGTGFRSV